MSKTTPLRIAESAARDLEEIQQWYKNKDVATVGVRLVAEVVGRFKQLREFPGSGVQVPEFESPLLRQLIQGPFRIVYRYKDGKIAIVRVWRSERLMTSEGLDETEPTEEQE